MEAETLIAWTSGFTRSDRALNTYSVDQHKIDVPTIPSSADDGKHITRAN